MPVNGVRFGLSLLEQIRLAVREVRLESATDFKLQCRLCYREEISNVSSLASSLFCVCISGISSDIWSYNRESLHLAPPLVSSRTHKQHSSALPCTNNHKFNNEIYWKANLNFKQWICGRMYSKFKLYFWSLFLIHTQYCMLSILYSTPLSRLRMLKYIKILSHKVICRHIPPSLGFKIVLKSDIALFYFL